MNDEMIYDETVEMPEKKTRFIAKHKNALIVALISLVLVGCLLFATFAYIVPEVKYYGALDDIENGNYKEAYITLKTLGNYKDSEKLLDDFKLIYLREEKLQYDEYEDLVRTEKIELTLAAGSCNLNPKLLFEAFEEASGIKLPYLNIVRTMIYDDMMNEFM